MSESADEPQIKVVFVDDQEHIYKADSWGLLGVRDARTSAASYTGDVELRRDGSAVAIIGGGTFKSIARVSEPE